MSKTVFLSRNKPQNSDAVDICLKYNRTFIGHPALRKGYSNLSEDMIDLRLERDELEKKRKKLDENCSQKQITTNWNLVHEIEQCCSCITLIPRPERGLVYAGRVKKFFFHGDPAWAKDYLELRKEQGLEIDNCISHVADVAQGWKVDKWRKVPFSFYPAWIRKSFFGRSTVARIHPDPVFGNPHDVLDQLIDNLQQPSPGWTTNISEIEQRLVSDIGPNEFEHLVVDLLQLEQPDRIWRHVGGSGDGGVDGMGLGSNGDLCAILQCKWNGGSSKKPEHCQGEYYFASLLVEQPHTDDSSVHIWNRRKIAELVKKHAQRLPRTLSMRIGVEMERVVSRDPEIHSGDLVFSGTRVPVDTLVDYLKGGYDIGEFLKDFPTVTRWQVESYLEVSSKALDHLGSQSANTT